MPRLVGSVARVFISPPSFFPLWNGRGKQKGKQSKQGARNLLIRRLANRKFTAIASQTGSACGVTKIQVGPYVWQSHAHVCGVYARGTQIGTAKACYELFPDVSVETALKQTVSEDAIALLLLGGYCSVLCSCQTELFIECTEVPLAAAHSGIDARNEREVQVFTSCRSCDGWELLLYLYPFKKAMPWCTLARRRDSTCIYFNVKLTFSLLFSSYSDRSETFLDDV